MAYINWRNHLADKVKQSDGIDVFLSLKGWSGDHISIAPKSQHIV